MQTRIVRGAHAAKNWPDDIAYTGPGAVILDRLEYLAEEGGVLIEFDVILAREDDPLASWSVAAILPHQGRVAIDALREVILRSSTGTPPPAEPKRPRRT